MHSVSLNLIIHRMQVLIGEGDTLHADYDIYPTSDITFSAYLICIQGILKGGDVHHDR